MVNKFSCLAEVYKVGALIKRKCDKVQTDAANKWKPWKLMVHWRDEKLQQNKSDFFGAMWRLCPSSH